MLSPEMYYQVKLEQHQDRLRRIERDQRLHNVIRPTNPTWHLSVCWWLGHQMKQWGTRLEQYGRASSAPKVTA